MNRGMITLTKPEITFVKNSLKNATNITAELPVRLTAAETESADKVAILLSEESAEVVLDCLPMPDNTENSVASSTRQAFSTFLSSLRFGTNDKE